MLYIFFVPLIYSFGFWSLEPERMREKGALGFKKKRIKSLLAFKAGQEHQSPNTITDKKEHSEFKTKYWIWFTIYPITRLQRTGVHSNEWLNIYGQKVLKRQKPIQIPYTRTDGPWVLSWRKKVRAHESFLNNLRVWHFKDASINQWLQLRFCKILDLLPWRFQETCNHLRTATRRPKYNLWGRSNNTM